MNLSFLNTRTRQIEEFLPLNTKGPVGLYACGPTVYNFAHIGNLRTYLFEDVLRRALLYAGYKLNHVMNITDVGHLTDDADDGEDKMLLAAKKSGKNPWQIAATFTDAFFEDCKKLNIQRPEIVCKATDHIPEMIAMVAKLEERGFTYAAGGNVYFDVSKFERYGDFALLDRMERRVAVNVDLDSNKRSPQDFVLWFTKSKFENQIMTWDSPWGRGYPGWHIECSAMSHRYLGEQFDIHCGGVDHIPVHHTNEIAQSEAANGSSPSVRYWLHGEFLLMSSSKMSKSAGGFLTLSRMEQSGFEPLDYRYFCLGAHYRTQLNYSEEALGAAKKARQGILRRLVELGAAEASETQLRSKQLDDDGASILARFEAAVSDDLNMPRALAQLWAALRHESLPAQQVLALVARMDDIFGLSLFDLARTSQKLVEVPADLAAEVEALIEQRREARAARNFARADEIRKQLASRGVTLTDTPAGTEWKLEKQGGNDEV